MIKKRISDIYKSHGEIQTRLSFIVLSIMCAGLCFSLFAAIISRAGITLCAYIIGGVCILAGSVFYAIVTGKVTVPSNMICVLYNIVLLPGMYLLSGGVSGGVAGYFILGIFICAVLTEGKLRTILCVVFLANYIALIIFFYRHPQFMPQIMPEFNFLLHAVLSLLIAMCLLMCVTILLVTQYKNEHLMVQSLNEHLTTVSIHDSLTNLFNRRYLIDQLYKKMVIADKTKMPLSIIMLDIDFFKGINDKYGHIVGDEVVKQLSDTMMKCLDRSDILGRYGGEEFLVLLPDKDEHEAFMMAEEIRKVIEHTIFGIESRITISGGISRYQSGMTMEAFIDSADKNLYKAKELGRNMIIR